MKGKRVCFVLVPNKWKFIDPGRPCCKNKCINTDRPNGYCIEGNGYIQIKSDTNIKYIECRDDGGTDKSSTIKTENQVNKPKENTTLPQCCFKCLTYSLFYYEIKFQYGENARLGLGFMKDQENIIRLWANALWYKKDKKISLPSFFIKTDDIIGCGLVYPPNNKLPYFFFTKNGTQIGKAVLLENYEYLQPYVALTRCSIEQILVKT
ncbi:hypothetical protein Mgra_00006929 [Meloidogyne graminicola]|uniref:SPRY domain-containing protein n=1 Tax=Meloidogyne graminicola TaxID=189291 RepID=A0A8S9ZJT1_9BILA|nr:hypothetical protein Mgra_00006929 [Meloidogyne graminicola]